MVMPIYSDLQFKALPANQSNVPSVANVLIGSALGYFPPETLYAGLIIANTWAASINATAGQTYITGSQFGSTNRHIFVCSNSGVTGSTEPTWNTSPGAITYDTGNNPVLWTEASTQFNSSNFSNVEPVDSSYARASFDNSSSSIYFEDPNNPNPIVTWPTSASVWGTAAGIFVTDMSAASVTGGNVYAWGLLAAPTPTPPSSIPASSFVGTLPLPNQQIVSSGSHSGAASVTGVASSASVWSADTGPTFSFSQSGVTAGNLLMLAVVMKPIGGNHQQSVVTVLGGGANWARVNNIGGGTGGNPFIEWWSGQGGTGGSITITVTMNGTYYGGATLFEMIGSAVPSAGVGQIGGTNAIKLSIQPVIQGGSCVLVASISNGGGESATPSGGWTAVNGPLLAGGDPIAGLVYQVTSAPTTAGQWITAGGESYPWATLGVVVAPPVAA